LKQEILEDFVGTENAMLYFKQVWKYFLKFPAYSCSQSTQHV